MNQIFKVFILFMFSISFAQAQTWEIGVTGGGMGYIGDLNQNNYLKINDPAFGFQIKRNFDSYWSLKLAALQGKVSHDDSKSKYAQEVNRNLSFYSPISEGSLTVEFNFLDYGFDFMQKRITPFVFSGIALTLFNPKTDYKGSTYELKYYDTEGFDYKTTAYSIPFGAGVKYNFGKYFNITSEIGYRNLSTDYLDDVSGVYPTATQLQDNTPQKTMVRQSLADRSINQNAVPGSQRGDFRKKDGYVFVGITLSYTFVSQNCYF